MLRAALAIVVTLAATTVPARAEDPDVDSLYACKKLPDGAKLTLSFKPGVTLDELVTWYSGFSCATVIYSVEVGCRTPGATIVVPDKISVAKARAIFFDAIEVMGLRARVKANKVVLTEAPGKLRTTPPACAGASTDPTAHAPIVPLPPALADNPDPDSSALDLSGIKKVDATHYEVPRGVIDAIIANPVPSVKGVRVVPAVKSGKPIGFKLYAIRAGSLFDVIGLLNGDTITAINGTPLTSADKALEIYSSLRSATTIEVSVVRKGKPITLEYVVK